MVDSVDFEKWLDRSQQDFKMIEIIKHESFQGLEDSVCYMCHQAVEKLMKAFILKNAKSLFKTHDLIFLLEKCSEFEKSLKDLENCITVLNEYAVSARYPDDFGDKRTIDEANEAYRCVIGVKYKFWKFF